MVIRVCKNLSFKMFIVLSVILFLTLSTSVRCQNDGLLVTTRNGVVRGFRQNNLRVFQGIPFAEPPIGELRFEPPVPKSNWNGVLDTIRPGNQCIQGNPVSGSEDCLFVNVVTPDGIPNGLPVIVWIHGGGFVGGNASDVPDYFVHKGVIWVALQYRLDFLGFITTGDLVAPGNAGLKDQVLALKWVQQNVEFFGGNPEDVTLFGQSSGAGSVAYHLQSPLSRGLFKKAILNSGTSLNPWALGRTGPDIAKGIAEALSVDTSSSTTLVQGLKSISVEALQQASSDANAKLLSQNPLHGLLHSAVSEPAHEGAFFTGKSHQKLSEGDFARVPIFIGFNTLEGGFGLGLGLRMFLLTYDLTPTKLVPLGLNVQDNSVLKTIASQIKSQYFGIIPLSLSNVTAMEYISDDQFIRGVIKTAYLVSKYVPTYLYYFSYNGLLGETASLFNSPTHSEELNYLFVRSADRPANRKDEELREQMVTLWTNFAKNGNPTPTQDTLLRNLIWPKFDEANAAYLGIGTSLAIENFPKKDRTNFWNKIFTNYGKPPFDTY